MSVAGLKNKLFGIAYYVLVVVIVASIAKRALNGISRQYGGTNRTVESIRAAVFWAP
jgi:uncharacterized membrane protein